MSISYPASLLAVGGAKTGIAPVNLLDVEDTNGNYYFWGDRASNAPTAILNAANPVAPPVPVPPGQQVAWSYAATVTPAQSGVGTATGSLTGGTLRWQGQTNHRGTATVTWSNFQLPPLPPGAVIQAVYPVMEVTTSVSSCTFIPSAGITFPALDFDGVFSGSSLGSSASAVTSYSASLSIQYSLDSAVGLDTVLISFIGLAVYYSPSASSASPLYKPWLLSVPSFSFHRSLQTDAGSFVVQNLSGDTLSRDMEKTLRASTLEGAQFVYRLWQADAQAAWIEVHGTLTVEDVGVDTLTFKGSQLINASQDDTPLENYSETCQLQWGGRRCGSTQSTECSYSYQTCQVVERIMVVMNDYEKNYGEALANTAQQVINRRRRF